MSHDALHPGQFGEQLKMFMSPQELIDTTDKADSRYSYEGAHPREQWERPGGSVEGENLSVREEKLAHLDRGDYKESFDKAPPVALFHGGSSGRLKLADGHHRLAHAERAGIPFIAVEHYMPRYML